MRIRTTVVTLVVCSFLWSPLAMAQQRHVVNPANLRQAIADQSLTDQQNRDAVLSVLHRSQVRELAGRLGLSVTRAEGAVSTLDSEELSRLADTARTAEQQLAGGDSTIVISATTLLIVVLLILLLSD